MPRKDERGMKVEKYKLSNEQIEFSKKFKRLQELRALLGGRATGLAMEMEGIRGMLTALDQAAQDMEVPENILRNLPEQNFA